MESSSAGATSGDPLHCARCASTASSAGPHRLRRGVVGPLLQSIAFIAILSSLPCGAYGGNWAQVTGPKSQNVGIPTVAKFSARFGHTMIMMPGSAETPEIVRSLSLFLSLSLRFSARRQSRFHDACCPPHPARRTACGAAARRARVAAGVILVDVVSSSLARQLLHTASIGTGCNSTTTRTTAASLLSPRSLARTPVYFSLSLSLSLSLSRLYCRRRMTTGTV